MSSLKKKRLLNYFRLVSVSAGLISFVGLIGGITSSCTTNEFDYSFVTTDGDLTGNLATFGFKPTCQELYNEQTGISSYVKQLNVDTEIGKAPSAANAELWLKRSPKVLYGYSYDRPSGSLTNYGFKSFIQNLNSYDTSEIESFKGRVDPSAEKYSKTWNLLTSIESLADKVDKVVREKDGKSIFAKTSIEQIVESVKNNLIRKLELLKTASIFTTEKSDQPVNISFWGRSFGPNWVDDGTKYDEYGPSIEYPGWLFDTSLGVWNCQPAVPSDEAYKLQVFRMTGFNAQGWKPTVGDYNAKAVQKAFEKSSDVVVVSLSNKLYNDDSEVKKVEENFKKMLKDEEKGKVLVIDGSEFSISPYDLLGSEYAINTLSEKLFSDNNSIINQIKETVMFPLNDLKVLSSKNFDFYTSL